MNKTLALEQNRDTDHQRRWIPDPSSPVRPDWLVSWELFAYPEVVTFGARDVEAVEARYRDDFEARKAAASVSKLVHPPAQRGEVRAWSGASRRRMLKKAGTLDLSGGRLVMVTLTLPGAWWKTRSGEFRTPDVFRSEVEVFRKRVERGANERHVPAVGCAGPFIPAREAFALRCIWKLEFQARSAPHLHMGVLVPEVEGENARQFAGRVRAMRDAMAAVWSDVVGGDHNHRTFGTHVDMGFSMNVRAKASTLAAYFVKHGVWSNKEYQHSTPDVMVARAAAFVRGVAPLGSSVVGQLELGCHHPGPSSDPVAPFEALGLAWETPGRWWGVWRLDVLVEDQRCDVPADLVAICRLLCRKVVKRRSQRLFADFDTGVEGYVSRSMASLHGASDRGFWLTATDAPGFLRWLINTAIDLRGLSGRALAVAMAAVEIPEGFAPSRLRGNCRSRRLVGVG